MTLVPKKKFLTPAQALEQLKRYCQFQERSHQEVRSKLLEVGVYGNDLENVMTKLIEEGYLNEERFAIAYAGGKFRMKGWGRNKIINELRRKGISAYCIDKAMKEIEDSDYQETFLKLLEKKAATIKDANIFSRKQKLSTFLIGKGYESAIVWKAVNDFFDKKKSS